MILLILLLNFKLLSPSIYYRSHSQVNGREEFNYSHLPKVLWEALKISHKNNGEHGLALESVMASHSQLGSLWKIKAPPRVIVFVWSALLGEF